jgi:hypothetical protein
MSEAQIHIPPTMRSEADAASAEASRIQRAMTAGFSTDAGLESAMAAAERLLDNAARLLMQVRQIRFRHRLQAEPAPARWTAPRKAQVVEWINSGRLTFSEALHRYDLSSEELQAWLDRYERHGQRGLRTTKLQVVR